MGIGTTTPAYPLDIISSASPILRVGRSNLTGGTIYLGNPSHGIIRDYNGVTNDVGLYTTGGDVHLFADNSAAYHLTVKSSGNVGVGTSCLPLS